MSTYLEGVNTLTLRQACTRLGLSVTESDEALAAPEVLVTLVNRLTQAVLSTPGDLSAQQTWVCVEGPQAGQVCADAQMPFEARGAGAWRPIGLSCIGSWGTPKYGAVQFREGVLYGSFPPGTPVYVGTLPRQGSSDEQSEQAR